MKPVWTARARRDLVEIGRYIAQDDPHAARIWIDRLRQRVRDAAASPLAGRVVPEFQREDIREVFLKSYRIVYRLHEDNMIVLTVFEGHRLLTGTRDYRPQG